MVCREQLLHLLTEAAEIEHNLLCSYLYAAFSLKDENDGLRAQQLQAVQRWRRIIVDVAIEEMGHLALVQNLLVALGGAVHFDRPNFPVAPGYHPAAFNLRLTPLNAATLEHFIFLERPSSAPVIDAAAFETEATAERVATPGDLTPSSGDYATIGEFYDRIKSLLITFAAEKGAHAFVDTGHGQLGPQMADLPGLATIRDLPSALHALDTIVEQGEGAHSDCQDCHYSRFKSIRTEWDEILEGDAAFEPAHPAAEDPVMRKPLDHAERVWITAPEAARWLDLGNALYGFMLRLLECAYDPHAPAAQRKGYVQAGMALMHDLARIGQHLARLPASQGRDHGRINAGLSFAVPRHVGVRHGDAHVDAHDEARGDADDALRTAQALNLLLERLDELDQGYRDLMAQLPSSTRTRPQLDLGSQRKNFAAGPG